MSDGTQKIQITYDFFKRMPTSDLRQIKEWVNSLTPDDGFTSINLESELVKQYRAISDVFEDVKHDETVPPSARAQVANSCFSALQQIAKLQLDLHGTEQVKKLEEIFITTLRLLPNAEEALEIYQNVCRKNLQ